MAHDRDVGGIRCLEVLEHLSDYLDGHAPAELRARVEAHVRGCDWCARFGGGFAGTVVALREQLGTAEPLDAPRAERLRARVGLG